MAEIHEHDNGPQGTNTTASLILSNNTMEAKKKKGDMHKKAKENKFAANIDTSMCLFVQIRVPASELRHWQTESKF